MPRPICAVAPPTCPADSITGRSTPQVHPSSPTLLRGRHGGRMDRVFRPATASACWRQQVSADPTLIGNECLRALWTGDDHESQALHASIAATAAKLPRIDLPLWVVHGASDGLLPTAFSSEPYVAWLREQGREPIYWKVPHAQHFDAFLALPGFGERHVPLLPYGYAALDRLWAHLYEGAAWPAEVPTPAAQPRGAGALERACWACHERSAVWASAFAT